MGQASLGFGVQKVTPPLPRTDASQLIVDPKKHEIWRLVKGAAPRQRRPARANATDRFTCGPSATPLRSTATAAIIISLHRRNCFKHSVTPSSRPGLGGAPLVARRDAAGDPTG